jgi:hypothetical protein
MLVTAGSHWNERNITDFWVFHNARQLAEVRDLIQLCRIAPARVADLLDQGYSRDCILWLAKKGICRLVSAQPHAAAD